MLFIHSRMVRHRLNCPSFRALVISQIQPLSGVNLAPRCMMQVFFHITLSLWEACSSAHAGWPGKAWITKGILPHLFMSGVRSKRNVTVVQSEIN